MKFEINYIGHERNARKLLVEEKIKTIEEIAFLSEREITDIINEHFVVLGYDEDYELVRKEDYEKISDYIKYVNR